MSELNIIPDEGWQQTPNALTALLALVPHLVHLCFLHINDAWAARQSELLTQNVACLQYLTGLQNLRMEGFCQGELLSHLLATYLCRSHPGYHL